VRPRRRPSLAAIARLVAAPLVAILIFGAGVLVGGHPDATGITELPDGPRSFLLGGSGESLPSQVLEALENGYYEDFDEAKLQRSSVDAIIQALGDPYTDYLSPDELRALRVHTEGAYFGVGLEVAQRGGAVVVTRVFADSPAERAEIKVGDRVVAVDGQRVAGRNLDRVVAGIRGPEGSSVTLRVTTPGAAPRTVELERARIAVSPVRGRIEKAGGTAVGYLKLLRFTEGAGEATRAEVKRLKERGARAWVLDLRGDPGGLVAEAVAVAGVFLPEDSLVVTTEGRRSKKRELRTDDPPETPDLPMAVLVDESSASSSEILAGALRDDDRATLVGTRTFGKALVQTTRTLRDGGALKLTTARYVTPDGHDVTGTGLHPSVRVADDPATAADEALQRALAVAAAG
jgi:carboxyl-terminal processing protease